MLVPDLAFAMTPMESSAHRLVVARPMAGPRTPRFFLSYCFCNGLRPPDWGGYGQFNPISGESMAFPRWALARTLWLAPLVVFFVVLAGCDLEPSVTPAFKGFDVTGASYAQDFRLTDFNAQERKLADFRGSAVLVYFGFIQCPDVCPTALTRAVEVKRLLGPAGDRLQVIFITVDPERDTPEVLKAYMAAFDPHSFGPARR